MAAGKTLAQNEKPLASDVNNIFMSGASGVRPATGDVTAGALYYETDTKLLYQEQAGSWVGLPWE